MTTETVRAPSVLRVLIEERGLRHVFVANKAGIGRSNLTRILNRERPASTQFVALMSTLLGVDASAFFDGRELLIATEVAPGANGVAIGTNPDLSQDVAS